MKETINLSPHIPWLRHNPPHSSSVAPDHWSFLPLCRLFHLHIFPRFLHGPNFHHDPSRKRWSFRLSGLFHHSATYSFPETRTLRHCTMRTWEHSHLLSDRFCPHTSSQNRHTILPGCQIHTSSRTSDRHCFQAAPLQPTQSADYQNKPANRLPPE